MIEACGIIKDELKELNVEVEIYGPNKEEDTQSVKDLISKNNVGDVVFDYPAVYDAEKSEKFIKSDIIVLLSRFEGLTWCYIGGMVVRMSDIIDAGNKYVR